jgi:hypothetical protein
MRWAFALLALALPSGAKSAEPMNATASCPAADAPGRVKCTAEARVSPGSKIAWADAIIVSTPPFIQALRGRIAPSDATDTQDELWRFAFAVVAKQRGKGEIVLRVRAVVCQNEACHPEEREVKTQVSVGE